MTSSSCPAATPTPMKAPTLTTLPPELLVHILTHLRATDLSSLQQTCSTFQSPTLTHTTILHFANNVYPSDLTEGFDTPVVGGAVVVDSTSTTHQGQFTTYEALRNMEMVVVARVLMRPEPSLVERRESGGFYVSKAWCRSALRWLECQAIERRDREEERMRRSLAKEEEERKAALEAAGRNNNRYHSQKVRVKNGVVHGKKGKKSKRKERIQNRRKGDVVPPSPYVNQDLLCEHGCLRSTINGGTNRNRSMNNTNTNNDGGSRSKRRLMDRQAWRVLKKLYPDGVQLSSIEGECLQCALEEETAKKNEMVRKEKETAERKKPLGCRLVRGFYTRKCGVPTERLATMAGVDHAVGGCAMVIGGDNGGGKLGPSSLWNKAICPLAPGIYNVIPRSWCHRWRKYIKSGEGGKPHAPDISACLCDAHKLPLIPPHLEAYLHGETTSLLSSSNSAGISSVGECIAASAASHSPIPSGIENSVAIGTQAGIESMTLSNTRPSPPLIVGLNPIDRTRVGRRQQTPQRHANNNSAMVDDLRASGLSIAEIETQRQMMLQLEERRREQTMLYEEQRRQMRVVASPSTPTNNNNNNINNNNHSNTTYLLSPEERRAFENAQLDRENHVVVEILTNEEYIALMRCWPENHSSYSLTFAVVESDEGDDSVDVVWTTSPCRSCDKSGRASRAELVVRNRCRSWVGNVPTKKK